MDSVTQKPHVVCIPAPAQSHITTMLKIAKLLHGQGIHITFVNIEYNHKRFVKSGGLDSFAGSPDFRFLTIPDGIDLNDVDEALDVEAICASMAENFLAPVVELLNKINATELSDPNPPITYILADGFTTTFSIDAADRAGIPILLYWTIPACAFMGMYQIPALIEKGILPLKDESDLTNGCMDIVIDWIPGMKDIRLKDLPSYVRIMDINNSHLNFIVESVQNCHKACGNIFHTFDEIEADVVDALSSMIPHVYTIGPVELLMDQMIVKEELKSIRYSLWKEEHKCLEWLDSKKKNSVIYVNFGSIAVLPLEKMLEIGWGLVNSDKYFLWVIRQTSVKSEEPSILPDELFEACKEKGFITSWCPQDKVIDHSSIGAFLTHCGWNSTLESLTACVPMICLPLFADQMTICRYVCVEWGVGLELDGDFKRSDVEKLVKEIMDGSGSKKMKNKALEWREMAKKATSIGGSSLLNFNRLVDIFHST